MIAGARPAGRFLLVAALTALGAAAVVAAQPPPTRFEGPARRFEHPVPPGAGAVRIGLAADDGRARQVTVVTGAMQASFLHRGPGAARYRVVLPTAHPPPPRVEVRVEPPAAVAFEPGRIGLRTRQPHLDWHGAGPTSDLPEPRPASPGQPFAEASVDETDTWGLRLFGVPVRAAPSVAAGLVGVVSHGERHRATCWSAGDAVTNGFPDRRAGAYDSDVWYRLVRPAGFVPDVRFARRGALDRLGLPRCQAEPAPPAAPGEADRRP